MHLSLWDRKKGYIRCEQHIQQAEKNLFTSSHRHTATRIRVSTQHALTSLACVCLCTTQATIRIAICFVGIFLFRLIFPYALNAFLYYIEEQLLSPAQVPVNFINFHVYPNQWPRASRKMKERRKKKKTMHSIEIKCCQHFDKKK